MATDPVRGIVDAVLATVRTDRALRPEDTKAYGVMSGSDLTVAGNTVPSYVKYVHVGELNDGDVVELDHFTDGKMPTVVGVIGTGISIPAWIPRYALKTGNESVTSSTTLQDDDQLTLTVAANKTYSFDGKLIISGATAGDFRWAFTFPAGATFALGGYGLAAAATTTSGDVETTTFPSAVSGTLISTFGVSATGSGVHIFGLLTTGANAGSITLQWAQGTSSGTPTVVSAGSHLRLEEVLA